jgi:hypothetical protein
VNHDAQFRVSLTLSVTDADALWVAAVDRGVAAGLAHEDVEEIVGPREDPALADCIAMLTAPAPLAGCRLGDFLVEDLAERAVPTAPRPASAKPTLAAVNDGAVPHRMSVS